MGKVLQQMVVRLLLCTWLGSALLQAAEVRGRIVDAMRSPIAGGQLTITGADGRWTTEGEGRFQIEVAPGRRVLRVRADGFAVRELSLDLGAGEVDLGDVVLQVEGRQDTVTVSESAGYRVDTASSATKTLTPLRDVPQSIAVVNREQMQDQLMTSMADVVRYVPGITAIQGENNRDQLVIRGQSTSADFFLDGVRDDVQYYRDVYNLEQVEALKGPNAMIFGRGGGGGVINRVSKQAGFARLREVTLQGGSFNNQRAALDLNQPLGERLALRFNGMFDRADSFRDFVAYERSGVNPSLTWMPTSQTRLTASYENFRDRRVADRGVPSYRGLPAEAPISTFFGNPEDSHVRALVNLGSVFLEHQAGQINIRNRTLIGDYDRFYQNYVPGVITTDGTQDSLSAYNNATHRRNVFNQTDVTRPLTTGRLRHTLLAGMELGRQATGNFRNTGYFNGNATALLVPVASPATTSAAVFRQSATDADNRLLAHVAAVYVQDQVELFRSLQFIAGLRFDRFDLQYHNNRTNENLQRIDKLLSPRAGLVWKPVSPLSLYGNYSVSYLPSSGDQFASLTTVTQQVKPEKFNNLEAGIKWDVRRSLSLTTAVYRLDRTNTRATDPNDPTRIVQTGQQRTNGFEIGATGSITNRWRIAGGYAFQDAFIVSDTTAARSGAQVAQVPHHSFSFWNQYQVSQRVGAGLGLVNRADMFAAVDNTVRLPGYTRADAAVYYSLTEQIRLQANAENLLDRRYYVNADSNNNISPGSGRAVRLALQIRF